MTSNRVSLANGRHALEVNSGASVSLSLSAGNKVSGFCFPRKFGEHLGGCQMTSGNWSSLWDS